MNEVPWPDLPVEERQHRKFQMRMDEKPPAEKPRPEVTEPGHYIDTYNLPRGGVKDVADILHAQGRKLAARSSETVTRGTEIKSGEKQGEFRPTKKQKHYSLATVDQEAPAVLAVWIGGKMEYARVRLASGAESWFTQVTTLKKFLKGELDG